VADFGCVGPGQCPAGELIGLAGGDCGFRCLPKFQTIPELVDGMHIRENGGITKQGSGVGVHADQIPDIDNSCACV